MTDAATSTPNVVTPTSDSNQPAQITVTDLFEIAKFLENLASMRRLSELEIAGIKPAFDRVVAFLKAYEAQMQTQPANPVSEVSTDEIDLAPKALKKKAGKKK